MNYWNHLKPQVIEFIGDLHFQGYTDTCIADVLKKDRWLEDEMFKHEEFNYRRAQFTLLQLCHIMDMHIGSDAFGDDLNWRIRLLLNVEYEQEITVREGQQALVEELR